MWTGTTGLAVVIGHGRNRKGREVLGWDGFQQNEPGTWEHLRGRREWVDADATQGPPDRQQTRFQVRMGGSSGESPFDA